MRMKVEFLARLVKNGERGREMEGETDDRVVLYTREE